MIRRVKEGSVAEVEQIDPVIGKQVQGCLERASRGRSDTLSLINDSIVPAETDAQSFSRVVISLPGEFEVISARLGSNEGPGVLVHSVTDVEHSLCIRHNRIGSRERSRPLDEEVDGCCFDVHIAKDRFICIIYISLPVYIYAP